MSLPITLPNVAALLTLACCIYLLGRSRMTEYQDQRIDFTFNHGRRHATAIRYLYALLELPPPPLDEEPPEPQPRWWARLAAWLRESPKSKAQAEVSDLARANPAIGAGIVDEDAMRQAMAEEGVTFEPDPNPSTSPIVMPEPVGIPTQPDLKQAATVAPPDAWLADFRARIERDLAEIREAK